MTAATHDAHDGHDEHGLHVSTIQFNATILGALLFLTALTYWTATLDLGFLDTPVALLIAFGKTSLVILYFMHVRWGSGYVKILAATGFVFLIFLFGFTFSDIMSRTTDQPWSDYTWPGAAHRSGILPDAPSQGAGVEHATPGIGHEGEHHSGGDEHHEGAPPKADDHGSHGDGH